MGILFLIFYLFALFLCFYDFAFLFLFVLFCFILFFFCCFCCCFPLHVIVLCLLSNVPCVFRLSILDCSFSFQ